MSYTPTIEERAAQYMKLREGNELVGPVIKIKTKKATSEALMWAYYRAKERLEYPRLVAMPKKKLTGGMVCRFQSSTSG